ncbi:MAG: CRISPR-associated endonuclease Cas2 [Patescibacteria group bacterium]
MAKVSITDFILETLSQAGEMTLEALFPENRVEGRFWRQVLGLPTSYRFSPRSFSATLSRLKRRGLVVNTRREKRSLWSATPKYQKHRLNQKQKMMVLPKPDGVARLVMFDIPEAERHKRYRIRTDLIACGYERLQKSVWLGYTPLPREFTELLHDLKIKDKVHIVKISGLEKENTA